MYLLQYIRTKEKESVRKYHMELTRAGPICIKFLENTFSLAETWTMTEVHLENISCLCAINFTLIIRG